MPFFDAPIEFLNLALPGRPAGGPGPPAPVCLLPSGGGGGRARRSSSQRGAGHEWPLSARPGRAQASPHPHLFHPHPHVFHLLLTKSLLSRRSCRALPNAPPAAQQASWRRPRTPVTGRARRGVSPRTCHDRRCGRRCCCWRRCCSRLRAQTTLRRPRSREYRTCALLRTTFVAAAGDPFPPNRMSLTHSLPSTSLAVTLGARRRRAPFGHSTLAVFTTRARASPRS